MSCHRINTINCIAHLIFSALILSACTLTLRDDGLPSVIAPDATAEAAPQAYTDAADLMQGICFAAANDAAGQVFTLRSAGELDTLYNLADNSGLCRRPVARATHDFSSGTIVVGTWSAGRGCTARHDVLRFERDDEARSIEIALRLVIGGDCPYELVRPFWVSIPAAQDYAVTLMVED